MKRIEETPQDYRLKWITAAHDGLQEGVLKRVNEILVFETNAQNRVVGWTFFEPRSLTVDVFDRLRNRVERCSESHRFTILMPRSFRERWSKEIESELSNRVEVRETSFFSVSFLGGVFRVRDRARVVCVDDSPLLLKLIKKCLESTSSFEVVACISNALEAETKILELKPDLVTMDIQMPGLTGVDLVRKLAPKVESPIIMVSSMTMEDGTQVFDALNSGAFEYVQKPLHDDLQEFTKLLSDKSLAGLLARSRPMARIRPVPSVRRVVDRAQFSAGMLWLIGASTGGTQALTQILTRLPNSIPPLLIVQHIPPVFSKAFAESLDALCPFRVKEAEHQELVERDCVYIAPGGLQMGLSRTNKGLLIEITDEDPVNRFKPSVDYLFTSASQVVRGPVIAGILTGMGKDGAQGLLRLKQLGGQTFAQDEASSAVFGMPRAAIEVGATQNVLSVDKVADFLIRTSLADSKTNAQLSAVGSGNGTVTVTATEVKSS